MEPTTQPLNSIVLLEGFKFDINEVLYLDLVLENEDEVDAPYTLTLVFPNAKFEVYLDDEEDVLIVVRYINAKSTKPLEFQVVSGLPLETLESTGVTVL